MSEIIYETRLRVLPSGFEVGWFHVRYRYDGVLHFEARPCRTANDHPAWLYEAAGRECSVPVDEADVRVRGSCKPDGCTDYSFPTVGVHACTRAELVALGVLLARILDQCMELYAVAGREPLATSEPVVRDAEPCKQCGREGLVISAFGARATTSATVTDDGHLHEVRRESVTLRCASGHQWAVDVTPPCDERGCMFGRDHLAEALDRMQHYDRRRR